MSVSIAEEVRRPLPPEDPLVASMARWWQNEVITPLNVIEDGDHNLYDETELEQLEVLFAPTVSALAASGMAAAHEIAAGDPATHVRIVRAAILYAFLMGKGTLRPAPFPIKSSEIYTRQEALDMIQRLADVKGPTV